MERRVRLLRHIRKTHTLITIVDRGATCASACIPVFLQAASLGCAHKDFWNDERGIITDPLDNLVDRGAYTQRF